MALDSPQPDIAGVIQSEIARAARETYARTGVVVPDTTQAFAAGVLFPKMHALASDPSFDRARVGDAALSLFETALVDRTGGPTDRDDGPTARYGARDDVATLGIVDLAASFARWPPPFGTIGV